MLVTDGALSLGLDQVNLKVMVMAWALSGCFSF